MNLMDRPRTSDPWNFMTGSGTTSATIGTQTSHAHGLGAKPIRILITPTANGTVYKSAEADSTNIYVKGSAASLTFDFEVLG